MATYYASESTGSNSNPGTISQPFLTITYAFTQMSTGDSLMLLGGDTFTESPSTSLALGTISSYGTGNATIVSSATGNITINFSTAPPLVFSNINVQNTSSTYASTGGSGFVCSNSGSTVYSSGYTISGCAFSNIPSRAIAFLHTSNDTGGVQNVTITNCTINNCGAIGIQFGNTAQNYGTLYSYSGITISNNTISNILGNGTGSGTSYGWAIILANVNISAGASSVTGNVIHDIGASVSSSLAGGGNAFQCEGCTGLNIYNNIAYNILNTNLTAGNDGGLAYDIDVSCINCTLYNCYCYNCDGGAIGIYSNSNTYTGNVFHHVIGVNVGRNTTIGGIYIDGTSPYVIYACTIIVSGSTPCVSFVTSGITPTCKILNCAFIAPAGVPTVIIHSGTTITSMVMDGNYHQSGDGLFLCTNATGTNYTSLTSWAGNTGWEASGVAAGHCHFVQPQPPPTTLAGCTALQPVATNPLIGAGANLSGTYSITPAADFGGNAWTQNCIGAWYVTGTPTNYANAVYADNPMFFWRLSEASGKSYDSVPCFEPMTWANATLNQASLIPGDGGASVAFNGSSTLGTTAVTPHTYALSSFSLEFTCEFNSFASAQGIVSSYDSALSINNFLVTLFSATQITIQLKDNSGNSSGASTTSSTTYTTATPYHFVVTWTGTGGSTVIIWYVNGQSVTISYNSQAIASTVTLAEMYCGNSQALTRYFNGNLQAVAGYPAVLSSTRAAAHYAAWSFAPGTATVGTITSSTIAVSATDATGGAGSNTYQWQQSTDNATWSSMTGTGTTTLSAVATGLAASTTYYFRLVYTDANSNVVYGSSVSATTTSGSSTSQGAALLSNI